jgi:hypothetical protein
LTAKWRFFRNIAWHKSFFKDACGTFWKKDVSAHAGVRKNRMNDSRIGLSGVKCGHEKRTPFFSAKHEKTDDIINSVFFENVRKLSNKCQFVLLYNIVFPAHIRIIYMLYLLLLFCLLIAFAD